MSSLINRFKEAFTIPLDEDLLYLLVHLYSISTGKPPIEKLFEPGGISGIGYNGYTRVLRYVKTLAKEYGLGYADAIRVNLSHAKNPFFKDFLMRFSETLSSGYDLESYLRIELETFLAEFKANYMRLLETIRVLLGVYIGVLSSVMFIDVNLVVLTYLMTGSIWPALAALVVTQIALWFLAFFMYHFLPRYRITHNLTVKTRDQIIFTRTLIASLIIGIFGFVISYIITGSLGFAMILLGLPLIVPGFIAYRFERKLRRIASFMPVMVKNYGMLYSTLGNELLVLKGLLRVNIGPLNELLRKAYARLSAGVERKNVWLLFAGESGSEISRRSVDIIYDSLESAADMRKVGERLGNVIADHINIQKSREQIARSFQAMVYLIHVILVALAQFIVTLIQILGGLLGVARELPIVILPFAGSYPTILGTMYVAILALFMSAVNAIAMKTVEGGYISVMILHLGALLILSGITIEASAILSDFLLKMFAEGIKVSQLTMLIPLVGGFLD